MELRKGKQIKKERSDSQALAVQLDEEENSVSGRSLIRWTYREN